MKRFFALIAPLTLVAAAHAQVGTIANVTAKYTGLKLGDTGKVTYNNDTLNVGVGKLGFDVTYNGEKKSVLTVCTSLTSTLNNDSHNYAVQISPDDFSPAGRAGKIVGSYFNLATTKVQAMGLQLAVWEAMTDNGSTFGNSGTFKVGTEFGSVTDQSSALYWANKYYSATSGRAAWLKTNDHGGQSQMTPVPEPASLAALAVGGMALLRRRKAKRS